MSVTGISGTNFAGLAAVKERLRALGAANVKVGWPKGPVRPDGHTVAQVAAWNEFGTERIPERPALRTGVKRALPGATALNRRTLKLVVDGRMAAAQALGLLGEFAVGEVKKAIVAGPWVENAPSTIARKKSTKPLIDTGQALNAVTYVVEGSGLGDTVSAPRGSAARAKTPDNRRRDHRGRFLKKGSA
jgi:hypothetical protein